MKFLCFQLVFLFTFWGLFHVPSASALIVFQDDDFHTIESPGLILDFDNIGSGVDVSIVANQGIDPNGVLLYNASTNVWQLSNDGNAFEDIATQVSVDLDTVYENDDDKILEVNEAAGLEFESTTSGDVLFDLRNTGDVVFQDTGTTFALFSDEGLFELTAAEDTERIRLTDTTNADSVGLYTGLGSPDTSLTAEAGSLFLDQGGAAYINTSSDSGTDWRGIDTRKAQTVTVAKSGGDFTSIKDAIDSISDNSAAKPYAVVVYPGVYDEDPITMKSYVNVDGFGAPRSVKIVATNASADLITLASHTQMSNMYLDGVSTGACVQSTTVLNSILINNEFEACEYGIRVVQSSLIVTGAKHSSGAMTTFLHAENGSSVIATQMVVDGGSPVTAYYATGTGTSLVVGNSLSVATGVTNGFYVNDGALVQVSGTLVDNATNGFRIGSTGSLSHLESSGGIVSNSDAYDLLVETSTAHIAISGGVLDRNKISVPPGNEISILFSDETDENRGTVNLGEFSAGSPENPSEANFGEGDNYTVGMLVYTATPSNVFTDVSAAAASLIGSTFTFPGTAANNAIYISSDRKDSSGNFVKFPGQKAVTNSTPMVLGAGSLVYEYWNGSTWVSFPYFCSHETHFHRYSQDCFLRPDSPEQIRFDTSIFSSWVTNDPPSTGTSRYWIRIRIVNAITTAPVFQQFKIQNNRMEIAANGNLTFFGQARLRQTFIASPEAIFFGRGNNAPDNASFNIGAVGQWVDERASASFSGIGLTPEELTGSIALPRGIDTSSPLRARIYWKKSSSTVGNVQWKLDVVVAGPRGVFVSDGANMQPAARTAGDDVTTINTTTLETTPAGGTDPNEVIRQTFSPVIPIFSSYEGDLVFLKLSRDPADVDDTYVGDAILTGFELDGFFWTFGQDI